MFNLFAAENLKKYWYLILLAIFLVVGYPILSRWGLERVGFLSGKVEGTLVVKDGNEERSRSSFVSCVNDSYPVELFTQEGQGITLLNTDTEDKSSVVRSYMTPGAKHYSLSSCKITAYEMDRGYSTSAYVLINFFRRIARSRDSGNMYWSGKIAGSCTVVSTNEKIEFSASFKNCHPAK